MNPVPGQMARPLVPCLLSLSLVLAFTGCLGGTADADVLVLEYTLESLWDPSEGSRTAAGNECAEAWVDGDTLTVQEQHHGRVGGDRFLFVDPTFEGDWATLGEAPWVVGLPATLDAETPDGEGKWTIIDHDGNDATRVDGEVVTLPHEWSVTAPDGSWRIDAVLDDGPSRYRVVDDVRC